MRETPAAANARRPLVSLRRPRAPARAAAADVDRKFVNRWVVSVVLREVTAIQQIGSTMTARMARYLALLQLARSSLWAAAAAAVRRMSALEDRRAGKCELAGACSCSRYRSLSLCAVVDIPSIWFTCCRNRSKHVIVALGEPVRLYLHLCMRSFEITMKLAHIANRPPSLVLSKIIFRPI